MASRYDAYDSRPRTERYDSYSRPRDYPQPKPTVHGPDETRQRGGERLTPYPNQHSNVPRYDYPPPLPPDTGRPQRYPPPPHRRSYIAYPPLPTCEDETTSLAKEAGGQTLLKKICKDEASIRGTIDQEPILELAPGFVDQASKRSVVAPSSDRRGGGRQLPTPPTSDDETIHKSSRRPSRLDMRLKNINNEVPELDKRTASPYAFAKSEQLPDPRFLSPESFLSPLHGESRNGQRRNYESRSQPVSPRRDSARYSPNSKRAGDYFSLSAANESALDDTDYDTSDSVSKASRTKPSTHPQVSAETPKAKVPRNTSVVDFASQPGPVPLGRLNLDARRNTDTANTLPTLPKLRMDDARRPTPLVAHAALSHPPDSAVYLSPTSLQSPAELPLPRSREGSYVSSRNVSPAGSAVGVTHTPPRSPRNSVEIPPGYTSQSSPASGSVSGSRPSSPSYRTTESPRLPRTDVDWSALLNANAKRSKGPSRLSSSIRQESVSRIPSGDVRQSSRAEHKTQAPYPMRSGAANPTTHAPFDRSYHNPPEKKPSLQIPELPRESKTLSRAASPAPKDRSFTPTGPPRLSRPVFPTRHSTTDVHQNEKRLDTERPKASETSRVAPSVSPQVKKDIQALAQKNLPQCPRVRAVAGYSDWYSLRDAPDIDFCPDCVEAIFERTIFRNGFRRAMPRSLDTKTRCALGADHWIRLAWLLTLKRQRTDLYLIKDMAEIDTTTEPCPGDSRAALSWYGLRDSEGMYLKDFRMCFNDVRKIERLLPMLSGLFVRLPHRQSHDNVCAMRSAGNRFTVYMDALIETQDKAMASRRGVDPAPFLALVKRRQRLRECTKDNLHHNGLWHFIPSLPELTCCEDCFASLVEPEIERRNELAMRFNRAVQPVYDQNSMGNSCQLYSRRMRRVFERAIQRNDFEYLASRAKERRENELRLQRRFRKYDAQRKRLSWDGSGSDEEGRWLDRELARITTEWRADYE